MNKYFINNPDVQLIHVTSCFENLKSILKEGGFRLKYCKEEFCIPKKEISKRVHPMVCFTEQNTKNLPNHRITYGKYGVAMTPAWIDEKNIQPVMYIEQKSDVANALSNLLLYRRKLTKGHPLRLPIMTIACFTKNAIGHNSHPKYGQNNFLFKSENEWRYVPTKKDIGNGYISESRSTFNKNPEKYNDNLKEYPLKFKITDILRIYCDTEQERKEIENLFPDLKDKVTIAQWTV